MAGAPVHRMRKKDIVAASKWTCKHGHNGLTHYNCYVKSGEHQERVGFLDIEASNLKADYGIMLTWCIKPLNEDIIMYDDITTKDLRSMGMTTVERDGETIEVPQYADARITETLVKEMKNYDRVVTYYGTGFDLPFIRTRARVSGIDFPEVGEINHTDLYYLVRNKFQLSSNRLENACRVILGQTNKTRIDSTNWLRALQGNKGAIDYILEHNEYDVLDLEDLYKSIIHYKRHTDNSI